MQKIEGRVTTSSIRSYRIFAILMGGCTAFFFLGFCVAISQNKIGGAFVAALMVLGGGWQVCRIYLNIKMKDGILMIDGKSITWELNGRMNSVRIDEVEKLSSWTAFTVLKDARGRKLISFPENQENYREILERLTYLIQNKHIQSERDNG